MWVLFLGLYTPDPAVLPTICPSEFFVGGMKEPSVYTHCCGWNLSGCMCLYVLGIGVRVGLFVSGMFILGAIFHEWENLILYCVLVGWMG